MSAADQLDDDFPHGTVEGYRRGCKGKICPGVAEAGQSCSQAWTRYNADYRYRKEVDAESRGVPKPVARPKPPAPRPVPAVDEFPPDTPEANERARREGHTFTVEAADERAREAATGTLPSPAYAVVPETGIPAAVEPKTSRKPAERPHGTTGGYSHGCRKSDEATCPSKLAGGLSCYEAYMAWYRRRQEAKKAEQAVEAPIAKGAVEAVIPVSELARWDPVAEKVQSAMHAELTARTKAAVTADTEMTTALAEEETVNAAPERTPELEATLAELKAKHPPLSGVGPASSRGVVEAGPAGPVEGAGASDGDATPDPTLVGTSQAGGHGQVTVAIADKAPVSATDLLGIMDLTPEQAAALPGNDKARALAEDLVFFPGFATGGLVGHWADDVPAGGAKIAPSPATPVPAGSRRDDLGDLQDETPEPPMHLVDDAMDGMQPLCGIVGRDVRLTVDVPFVTCEVCLNRYEQLVKNSTLRKVIAAQMGKLIASPWSGTHDPDSTGTTMPTTEAAAPTTDEGSRRSPNPVTPYDDPHTLFQRLVWPDLRRMWLKGYRAGKGAA